MMKKMFLLLACTLFLACGQSNSISSGNDSVAIDSMAVEQQHEKIPIVTAAVENKQQCFIVISKLAETLSVYEAKSADTVLVARYPVCMGKNKGNKEKKGDMKTPESPKDKPFFISQIQDASDWHHDFGDGRGSILAYGHWFLRLNTPGHSGIGIHGSTNNEESVPGRASEGCIRLRDADIIDLKENYAFVNMTVIIKAEEEGALPFEK